MSAATKLVATRKTAGRAKGKSRAKGKAGAERGIAGLVGGITSMESEAEEKEQAAIVADIAASAAAANRVNETDGASDEDLGSAAPDIEVIEPEGLDTEPAEAEEVPEELKEPDEEAIFLAFSDEEIEENAKEMGPEDRAAFFRAAQLYRGPHLELHKARIGMFVKDKIPNLSKVIRNSDKTNEYYVSNGRNIRQIPIAGLLVREILFLPANARVKKRLRGRAVYGYTFLAPSFYFTFKPGNEFPEIGSCLVPTGTPTVQ